MKLTAEKIQGNWVEFLNNIETHITGKRKKQLLDFYNKYGDRIMMMPASHKKEYHSAFPGGYVDHVNRVVNVSLSMSSLWKDFGCDMTTFTTEELIFSAINHDLGKMGVPDRGLFLLQEHGISYTFNEMIGIQTHDGLYDSANDKYLKGYMPEQKPRTSLPFILHQADMLAARVEFEIEWLPKFKHPVDTVKKSFTLDNNKKSTTKNKALSSIQSEGLQNIFNKL